MIFRWPLLLAALSLLGLLSALLGDELYDVMSWLSLGVPVVLTAFVWARLHVPATPTASRRGCED